MALSVADNLRRCIERFGSTVSTPTRSRPMTQRSGSRYMARPSPVQAETIPTAKEPQAPPPAE